MAQVYDLSTYREMKKRRTEPSRAKNMSKNYSYNGKLAEAMEKYGSHTGKKIADRFKDKIDLEATE